MSGWILAIDVRDGEHLAVPAAAAVVSFDMLSHRKFIENSLLGTQTEVDSVARVIDHLRGAQAPEGLISTLANNSAHAVQDIASLRRKMDLIEAILRFDNYTFLVRDVRFAETWQEVIDFTTRPVKAPTSK